MSDRIALRTEERIRRELGHLSGGEATQLAQMVERLVDAYQPERIYLFGSKARGDAGPDSDFDLMVIVPDAAPAEQQQSRLAYERLWGTGTAADVLVWPARRFAERTHLRASLPATILREGRLLYAARCVGSGVYGGKVD
jgi:predicted nucleotidyltransferase